MQLNDLVKYSKPQKGEEDIRFRLREINGDRVLLGNVTQQDILSFRQQDLLLEA